MKTETILGEEERIVGVLVFVICTKTHPSLWHRGQVSASSDSQTCLLANFGSSPASKKHKRKVGDGRNGEWAFLLVFLVPIHVTLAQPLALAAT